MKHVALLLLLVNVGLWFYFSSTNPGQSADSPNREMGRLPRVSELVLMAPGEGVPETIPDVAGDGMAPIEEGGDDESGLYEPMGAPVANHPALIEVKQVESFCVRLGWFESAEEAREAEAWLPGDIARGDIQIREIDRDLGAFHWVIIPPLPSEDEALALFREIQRRGIDSYLVTEGPQKNAISLGLFESRSAAEQVLAQRNAQNINAVLALFPRNHISYALVFEAAYVPGSQELVADQAEFSRRFDSVEISGCEGVATAEKNP